MIKMEAREMKSVTRLLAYAALCLSLLFAFMVTAQGFDGAIPAGLPGVSFVADVTL